MRTQLGADGVDIDTRASTCRIAFAEPGRLDFLATESAAADAGYVLTQALLSADGEVLEGWCKVCGHESTFFELPGTGQRYELIGDWQVGKQYVEAEVDHWGTTHPQLVERGSGSGRE